MSHIQGLVKQAYKTGPGGPLQPEQMIALLQAVAENQDDPQQMSWLNAEYPAIYNFIDGIDEELLLRGRSDPSALREAAQAIADKIAVNLDKMRWDDLGLSPAYESAARRLFPRDGWSFIQDHKGKGGTKEPRFIMEEDAYRPLIPGQTRIDQKMFDWNMQNDLEDHLSKLGIDVPDVVQIELGTLMHRIRNDYLHVPPKDAALLMDAKALGTRGARLGEGAEDWIFARRMNDANTATIPLEYALGMRGVAYGLPDREPETVRMACANRIAQRISGDENAEVRNIGGQEKIVVPDPTGGGDDRIVQDIDVKLDTVDGRECVLLKTDDARVLLAPIALGDPAAKFSTSRQTLRPDAKGFDGENAVFLTQAAKLAYQDQETISLYTEAWGLQGAKLHEHADSDGQAFVAYDEEKNSIVIAFRGTESRADVFIDADFGLEKSDLFPEGEVPGGFLRQFSGLLPMIMGQVEQIQADAKAAGKEPPSMMVGGHSLGGALAGMFTRWGLANGQNITQTYTCGQPPWNDKEGAAALDALLGKTGCNYFRFVNNNDIVPRVPPTCTHAGTELYIDHHGKLMEPGLLSGGKRALDRLHGIVKNWSMSSGIDVVDSVSDHYVDFYLGYARKNRGVEIALDAASTMFEVARNVLDAGVGMVGTAARTMTGNTAGDDDDK